MSFKTLTLAPSRVLGRLPKFTGGLTFDKKAKRWRIVCRNGRQIHYARGVMEAELGRPLDRSEHIHHINGDPCDDRVENLMVVTPSEHAQIHHGRGSRWARDYDACLNCGLTKYRHTGFGECQSCRGIRERGNPRPQPTSKHRGVSWEKRRGRWLASVQKDGQPYRKTFRSEADAAAWASAKRDELELA